MWDDSDKQGYILNTHHEKGQIGNDAFSDDIIKYASDLNNKTFLEIGTWNGYGSTRFFVNTLEKRKDDYVFYSLECNKDKSVDASRLYKGNDKLHILNEVIWNEEPSDFYDVFPQCKDNELYKHWNDVDIVNMKSCNRFLNRTDLPTIFDVILLDGGEFTTYHEFQILKNRCKILMLDDINTAKCTLIVNEIETNTNIWRVLKKCTTTRNGYIIAEKMRYN